MPDYFRINFADPGKNVSRLDPHKEKIQRILRKKMGISLSFLVVFLVFMTFGGVFYFTAVHLPMEKELEEGRKKLKETEVKYKTMAGLHQEQVKKVKNALKTIDEINQTKKNIFHWSDRLQAMRRILVNNLWLSSLGIIDKPAPPPPKAKKDSKKGASDKKKMTGGYVITINGATFSNPVKKPLKKISKFMTNLINEPYWGNYFSLKDWKINTTEKETEFEVILESKHL
jgi:hypothetical protein